MPGCAAARLPHRAPRRAPLRPRRRPGPAPDHLRALGNRARDGHPARPRAGREPGRVALHRRRRTRPDADRGAVARTPRALQVHAHGHRPRAAAPARVHRPGDQRRQALDPHRRPVVPAGRDRQDTHRALPRRLPRREPRAALRLDPQLPRHQAARAANARPAAAHVARLAVRARCSSATSAPRCCSSRSSS